MRRVPSTRIINLAALSAGTGRATMPLPDARFAVGPELFHEDFAAPSDRWRAELERGGAIDIGRGRTDIDVPAGATV